MNLLIFNIINMGSLQSIQNLLLNKKSIVNSRCNVPDCKENHPQHYCKNCKNSNSNHFSGECPILYRSNSQKNFTLNKTVISQTGRNCKVPGCNQNHKAHFCNMCQNKDSDHFGKNCPKGMNPQYFKDGNTRRDRSILKNQPIFVYLPQLKKQSKNEDLGEQDDQSNEDNAAYNFLQQLAMASHQFNLQLKKGMEDQSQDSDSQSLIIRCKVNGCTLQHNQHSCRMCKEQDADHIQDNCPQRNAKQTLYQNQVRAKNANQKQKMKCKAKGCQQNHAYHYCGNCNTKDSNHRAKECLQAKRNKEKCRAIGCSKNHLVHYCRICEKNDVDHTGRNCPQGITAYHGTTEDCAKLIQKSRMQPSKNGNLGPGIYFTPVKQAAIGIAKLRQRQQKSGTKQKSVLITAKIKKKEGHFKEKIHGPWRGAYQKDFPEISVTDDNYLRIEGYQYV